MKEYKDLNANQKYIFNAIDEALLKIKEVERIEIIELLYNKYYHKGTP